MASLGFILLLTPKSWPGKYLGLFLLIPLLWPNTVRPKYGESKITLLDVGQGLAVVVQTSKHTLVFDTGPQFSQNFDTGAAVIVPFIRQKNIRKLDILIVSHKDNDHRGGLHSIQQELNVVRLISSYDEKGSKPCYAGQRWIWDGVLFEMLNPSQSETYSKRNNASCVLKVSTGGESVLLSADIEIKAEKRLVDKHYEKLKSTYLVAPHHGSKTSSSVRFLDAVDPEYILIPVGYKNRYRMPHSDVLQRYTDRKIPAIETHRSGAISVNIGQNFTTKTPQQYRKDNQKYWNSYH